MSAFTQGTGNLQTVTRVGNIPHEYVIVNPDVFKNLTFKEAYAAFVNALYTDSMVIVGNGRAVVLRKKTAYSALLEPIDEKNAVVHYPNWKKVTNLKNEFKLTCGKEYKVESK